jgi:hypothetical protein
MGNFDVEQNAQLQPGSYRPWMGPAEGAGMLNNMGADPRMQLPRGGVGGGNIGQANLQPAQYMSSATDQMENPDQPTTSESQNRQNAPVVVNPEQKYDYKHDPHFSMRESEKWQTLGNAALSFATAGPIGLAVGLGAQGVMRTHQNLDKKPGEIGRPLTDTEVLEASSPGVALGVDDVKPIPKELHKPLSKPIEQAYDWSGFASKKSPWRQHREHIHDNLEKLGLGEVVPGEGPRLILADGSYSKLHLFDDVIEYDGQQYAVHENTPEEMMNPLLMNMTGAMKPLIYAMGERDPGFVDQMATYMAREAFNSEDPKATIAKWYITAFGEQEAEVNRSNLIRYIGENYEEWGLSREEAQAIQNAFNYLYDIEYDTEKADAEHVAWMEKYLEDFDLFAARQGMEQALTPEQAQAQVGLREIDPEDEDEDPVYEGMTEEEIKKLKEAKKKTGEELAAAEGEEIT